MLDSINDLAAWPVYKENSVFNVLYITFSLFLLLIGSESHRIRRIPQVKYKWKNMFSYDRFRSQYIFVNTEYETWLTLSERCVL